jgi:hypothetical protein
LLPFLIKHKNIKMYVYMNIKTVLNIINLIMLFYKDQVEPKQHRGHNGKI